MLGKPVPDFSLPSTGDSTFTLSSARGKKLVVTLEEIFFEVCGIPQELFVRVCEALCSSVQAQLGSGDSLLPGAVGAGKDQAPGPVARVCGGGPWFGSCSAQRGPLNRENECIQPTGSYWGSTSS